MADMLTALQKKIDRTVNGPRDYREHTNFRNMRDEGVFSNGGNNVFSLLESQLLSAHQDALCITFDSIC